MNFDWTVSDLAVLAMAVSGTALWDREVSGKIKTNYVYNHLKNKTFWKTVKFSVQFVIFCCTFLIN